jgi:hypothetical protein
MYGVVIRTAHNTGESSSMAMPCAQDARKKDATITEAQLTALDYARDLNTRGFAVIPVPFGKKKPRIEAWPELRIDASQLQNYFRSRQLNVGVLLGEPSGWLIDIDLDHPSAVELAPEYLLPTGMIWGRESKPRSHLIYRVTAPVKTRKWTFGGGKSIVELRSTGAQTIAPGSRHPGGEFVRWDTSGQPAVVDADELTECLNRLKDAVCSAASLPMRRQERAGSPGREVVVRKNPKPLRSTSTVPADPADQKDPTDPKDPMTPDDLVQQELVTGPGQHDSRTMRLARGLKLDCGIQKLSDALPYFYVWWELSRQFCNNESTEEARWKFQRAFDTAVVPLNGVGVAAKAFAAASLSPIPEPSFAAEYENPNVRSLLGVLWSIGEMIGGEVFALSSYQAAEFLGVAPRQAHRYLQGLVSDGVLICEDPGTPGKDSGKAARYRWQGGGERGVSLEYPPAD